MKKQTKTITVRLDEKLYERCLKKAIKDMVKKQKRITISDFVRDALKMHVKNG